MILANQMKYIKRFASHIDRICASVSALILTACGGGKANLDSEVLSIGFSDDYIPPNSNFDQPIVTDPNFKLLEPDLVVSYWTQALEMNDAETDISQLLINNNRIFKFSFPIEAPSYLPISITGWAPADTNIIEASREIFTRLEEVLDIKIEETDMVDGLNILAISQSIQASAAGFSYFPNNYYQLGSDIFISKDYSNPLQLESGITNYDYEVLVHEIGHAFGLKHPFETDRNNLSVLNSYEDDTKFTAMSYDDDPITFNGDYRSLDWMALTKLYGVNANYNAGNNFYKFDAHKGTFIIDGNGVDTVSNTNSVKNIYIDLRPGMHSYEGQKSSYITDAYQLTISHGSEVENVETGLGNDIIIGNQLANLLISNAGDDEIFAGEGMDIINSGLGKDIIDLSEDIQVEDRIVLEAFNKEESFDTVYGFSQGSLGDVIDITDFNFPELNFLPLIDVLNIPTGYVDYCIVRIFGGGLTTADSVTEYFSHPGSLDGLKITSGKQALLVAATSQDTGEAQNIFSVQQNSNFVEVHHLTQFAGNYLDIDNWSLDNFLI